MLPVASAVLCAVRGRHDLVRFESFQPKTPNERERERASIKVEDCKRSFSKSGVGALQLVSTAVVRHLSTCAHAHPLGTFCGSVGVP